MMKIFSQSIKKLYKDQSGISMVLLTFFIFIIVCFTAIVVDVGNLYMKKQLMQTAVDAAALGAVQDIDKADSIVNTKAKELGEKNGLKKDRMAISINKTQRTVKVDYSYDVPTYFAKIFTIDSVNIGVTATAQVTQNTSSAIYDYVLFADNEYFYAGSQLTVDGMVHVNGDASIWGGTTRFNERMEVVGRLQKGGDAKFKQLVNPATPIQLPEFDMNYYRENASIIYPSNYTFSGPELVIDGIIFVNGNVQINAAKVKGKGTIVATGSIQFSVSGLDYSTDNLIGLFSGGDINLNLSNLTFVGLLYAPNGSIAIPSSGATIRGGLIAKNIRVYTSNHHYIYDSRIKELVSKKVIKLID